MGRRETFATPVEGAGVVGTNRGEDVWGEVLRKESKKGVGSGIRLCLSIRSTMNQIRTEFSSALSSIWESLSTTYRRFFTLRQRSPHNLSR